MVTYLQFDGKKNNVLFEDCFIKDPKIGEKEVIKRLLASIRETPHALAVAANQIGIKSPYLVLRNPIRELEKYTSITQIMGMDQSLFRLDPEYTIIKNPVLWFYSDSRDFSGRECCLSCDNLGEVATSRKSEVGIAAQFLDMQAYQKNRNNLIWNRRIVDHITNLAAQVLQHEVEHLHGSGIWSHRFNDLGGHINAH